MGRTDVLFRFFSAMKMFRELELCVKYTATLPESNNQSLQLEGRRCWSKRRVSNRIDWCGIINGFLKLSVYPGFHNGLMQPLCNQA